MKSPAEAVAGVVVIGEIVDSDPAAKKAKI